tara:strand:- start:33 stop:509 length:477 start_codon:yes stop_codon:yes gene_type:complete
MMPSYYDSKKKKPSKARLKYKIGGEIKTKKKEEMTNKEYLQFINEKVKKAEDKAKKVAEAKYNKEYKKSLNEYASRKARGESKKNIIDKVGDFSRDKIGGAFNTNRLTSQDDKARMQARKDILGFKKGGKVKKMSKGGQLKVRGMGAATRGGNFTRNG